MVYRLVYPKLAFLVQIDENITGGHIITIIILLCVTKLLTPRHEPQGVGGIYVHRVCDRCAHIDVNHFNES